MTVRDFLARTPLLAQIDAELSQQLASAASTQTYARGAELWRVDDTPRALVFVRSGLVKLTRPAPKGRTAICGLYGTPSAIGELVLVKGVPYQTGAVAATASVTLVSIPRAVLLPALERHPRLALNLFCGFEEKLSMLHDKIDVLSAGSVEARLATLLLKLYHQFGDDFDDGTSRVPVPLSRQELADMVSTTFETAIRVLTRWERDGLVSTDDDGFTLRSLALLVEASGSLLDLSPVPQRPHAHP
jgi:CRP/FNR family transcriptional regulator